MTDLVVETIIEIDRPLPDVFDYLAALSEGIMRRDLAARAARLKGILET
jgi:hypothetical protein